MTESSTIICHICGCSATKNNWVVGFPQGKKTCERCHQTRIQSEKSVPPSTALEFKITDVTLIIQNLNNSIVELNKTVKSLKESLEKLNVDKNGIKFL